MKDIMLHPDPWGGIATRCTIPNMEWIQELGNKTWCDLWLQWPSKQKILLPQGYNSYVVSFHMEAVDLKWLWNQSKQIEAPIIVLTECDHYDTPLPTNVTIHKFYWWHQSVELIKKLYPQPVSKQISHQFSAICNRITQSKLLITTALLELNTNSIIKLSTWKSECAELRTGSKMLDKLHDTFYNKWYGQTIDLEDTHTTFQNNTYYTSDPWTDVYQKCAMHFTNESFHYSYMQDEFGHYTYPGPFITEKTLKCLVGATGFIPVGQFDTYNALTKVGFKFDYDFNTDFDSDHGNISRLESMVNLIEELSTWTKEDLFEATKDISNYNQEYIYSQDFYRFCETQNQKVINDLT
jgi:hypothetical protein